MGKRSFPRSGSLQVWPRKKAEKILPSVNWKVLKGEGLLGFIVYKVGMKSALVKDLTKDSMTKEKRIALPVSILEAPSMKIFSVRLYKNNLCTGEIILNEDKELKKILRLGKTVKMGKVEDVEKKLDKIDDIRLIVYSQVKKTGIKKTPDLTEIGLGGSLQEKLNFIKSYASKEISASEILKKMQLVDVRGLSKGKGLSGPVKRFGIGLKAHKSEKGRRRPGSLGPWHPAHTSFRTAQAGQLGFQTRLQYNSKIIEIGKINEKDINPASGFKHFGKIKTEYIIISGSVPGSEKRALMLTSPLRKTKKTEKKNYEFIELK